MMMVYIDSDCKCHLSDDGTMTAVQTRFFDGMCQEFIEGYRFVPSGRSWTREDGVVFTGEMISPWKNYSELDAAQREYEQQRVSELEVENETLLNDMAQMIEEVYLSDMEMMEL